MTDVTLTCVHRRFNTHVSALFTENQTLREQYDSFCLSGNYSVANAIL